MRADLLRGNILDALLRCEKLMKTEHSDAATVTRALRDAAELFISDCEYSLEAIFAAVSTPLNPKILNYLSAVCTQL